MPHRIPGLDGLRAVAVCTVLLVHLLPHYPVLEILSYGAVDVFFVLSGYLITTILVEAKGTMGQFYLRRAARLVPPLVLVWAFVQSVQPSWCNFPMVFWLGNVPRVFGFDPPAMFGHTWSLAIEEQFYLVWPWVVWGVGHRAAHTRSVFTVFLGVVAAVLATIYLPYDDLNGVLYYSTPTRLVSLGLGGMLATRDPEKPIAQAAMDAMKGTVALFAWAGYCAQAQGGAGAAPIIPAAYAAFSSAILLTVLASRPLAKMLDAAPLRWIGRISYGLYLYHLPIYVYCGVHESPERALIALIATCLAASLSFVFVESPIMQRARR